VRGTATTIWSALSPVVALLSYCGKK